MSTEQARNEPRTTAGRRLLADFRSKTARDRKDYPVHWLDAADIIAIEREAIADFLATDLPGLLAEALLAFMPGPGYATGWRSTAHEATSQVIAAIRQRIAEGRCGWGTAVFPGEPPNDCLLLEGHTGDHQYARPPAELRSANRQR